METLHHLASSTWRAPWRWPAAWVHAIAIVALIAWIGLQCFGALPLNSISTSTFDQMQRLRMWASPPDPRILIVDIDERSLAEMAPEFGSWPWSRDTLATVLDDAKSKGAEIVAFDILFSDPDRTHPGGDRALEAAVRDGNTSFFPVVRLPARLDSRSELRLEQLPGLGVAPKSATESPRVALVLPFMKAMVDSGRLGTHTAHLDSDGKIRRFAFNEALAGGWMLRSLPAAVALHAGTHSDGPSSDQLIVWRQRAEAYPRVSFSTAWQCAEGQKREDCPNLAGRILVIGATASSLHDIKSSPLATPHMGVDILATLIDNAIHQRSLSEISPTLRWIASVAALLVAWAVVHRGRAGSTSRALWALPLFLIAIGYASLHTESLYIDLSLPAAAALTFLSLVKMHDTLRRYLFGLHPNDSVGPHAVVCGGPSGQSERLERTVLDLAGRHRMPVTGTVVASGESGAGHSMWVLWNVPDKSVTEHLVSELCRTYPAVWAQGFDVGGNPQRDFLSAAVLAMPASASGANQ